MKLTSLRLEERRLLQQFGPDHPEVQKVRDRVHAYEQLVQWMHTPELVESQLLVQMDASADEMDLTQRQALVRELLQLWSQNPDLLELQIRERELLKNLGPDHPQVKATAEQIERLLEIAQFLHPSSAPCSATPTSESR